jgi:tetratricopeptide (TPR) repeat protein
LDAAFEADEARKSNLILRARMLRDQHDDEQASQHFAEAAEIEESLSDRCEELGLVEKSFVHRFSAASCWAHAGNIYEAIRLCDELLGCHVPDRLRQDIEDYAQALRRRRAQLYAQLTLVGANE